MLPPVPDAPTLFWIAAAVGLLTGVVGGEGSAFKMIGATLSAALDGQPPAEVVPLRGA